MSRFLASLAAVLMSVTAGSGAPPGCTDEARAVLAAAAAQVDTGDDTAALDTLRAKYADAGACPAVAVAAWSLRGWHAAGAADARGGAPDTLADVTTAVTTLDGLGPGVSDAGYAAALLHAATAAAQDERDELRLWLDQARDVSRRLALAGPAPRWPLPIDRAEGELWLRVDDFELAETAFIAASRLDTTAAAFRGLARARDRRGQRGAACAAYREVASRAAAGSPYAVEARGYLLLCTP